LTESSKGLYLVLPPGRRVTTSVRIAVLTVYVGFVVKGVAEAYEYFGHSWLPGTWIDLYWLGPLTTLVGFVLVWRGRHEWEELHANRVRHGHAALATAILTLGLVVAFFVGTAVTGGSTTTLPSWTPLAIAAAITIAVGSAFLGYLFIVYQLVSGAGKVLLVLATAWALVVGLLTGLAVATAFPRLLSGAHTDLWALSSYLTPLSVSTGLLFVSYFLLVGAYHEAYRRVRSRVRPPASAPPTVRAHVGPEG